MDKKERELLFVRFELGETELFEVLEKEYTRLVEECPNNLQYVKELGCIYQIIGSRYIGQAEQVYEKALFNPECKDSRFSGNRVDNELIMLRHRMGRNKQSIELYKQRILEYPDDPIEYSFLAMAYLNADQVQEAKKVMDAAQKITHDGGPNFFDVLGDISARLGDNEQALEYWDRAVQNQYCMEGWFSRVFLFQELGRLEEAAAEWRKIIAMLGEFHDPKYLDFPRGELAKVEEQIAKSKQ